MSADLSADAYQFDSEDGIARCGAEHKDGSACWAHLENDGHCPNADQHADFREPVCVCNIGVQECSLHPGRLRTKEQKIEFRKMWDAEVH